MFIKSNKTCSSSGTRTIYPSGAREFTSSVSGVSVVLKKLTIILIIGKQLKTLKTILNLSTHEDIKTVGSLIQVFITEERRHVQYIYYVIYFVYCLFVCLYLYCCNRIEFLLSIYIKLLC